MKKEHQWAIGAIIVGALLYHFLTFASVYESQPHDFNCNRAQTQCDFFGGTDNTPYADCDSCCPEATDTCSGKMTPYVGTSEGTAAADYCSAFTCAETGRTCGAVYISQIAMLGWQCTCDTR